MIVKNLAHIFVIGLCLLSLTQCHAPQTQDATHQNSHTHATADSIYEKFELLADTAPQHYIAAPDSFLRSFRLDPQSVEQQEMYTYGLLFMAYGLREHGDHYNSIRYYEKALEAIRRYELEEVDKHLYIYKPLAALYTLIDDNQKSIGLLEGVLQELTGDRQEERAGYANNLANAYLYNNEPDKAQVLLVETLAHTKNPLAKALLYNSLSVTYLHLGQREASIHANRMALQRFEKHHIQGDTLLWYCSALTQYGDLHQDMQAARRSLRLLQDHYPQTQHRSKASAQLILADMLYRQNDIEKALPAYQSVIQTFKQLGTEPYVLDYKHTQALHAIARCYAHLRQPDSALNYFQWAIENDFRTQQLITSRQNQLHNNVWSRQIIDEMAELVDQQLQQNPNDAAMIQTLLWCIELSKGRLLINEINRSDSWDHANEEVKGAIQEIRHLHRQMTHLDDVRAKQKLAAQIRQTIIDFQLSERYFETWRYSPEKERFLAQLQEQSRSYFSYFVRQDSSLIAIGLQDGQYRYHPIRDRSFLTHLREFKETYFGATANNYNLDPQAYREEANDFVRQLLPDLRDARPDVHLSLDGELYGLPFDALWDGAFLVEKHNVAYLNSFIIYDLLRADNSDHVEISLLYRAEFPDPLPDLNFVPGEVAAISRRFATHKIAPEKQQDSTIVGEFAAARAIHIASHTLLDSTENPILYLREPISTEQLRFYHIHSPMIFLSACHTGSGQSLPSEGMESIQRVFLSKGVPSVISTYWFANDEAMLRLTTLFYDCLASDPRPVAALAQAKRRFLKTASVEQQNPWYWANINYAGVDNKVGLRKSTSLPRLTLAGIVAVIFILFVIYLLKGGYRAGRGKSKIRSQNEAS